MSSLLVCSINTYLNYLGYLLNSGGWTGVWLDTTSQQLQFCDRGYMIQRSLLFSGYWIRVIRPIAM